MTKNYGRAEDCCELCAAVCVCETERDWETEKGRKDGGGLLHAVITALLLSEPPA